MWSGGTVPLTLKEVSGGLPVSASLIAGKELSRKLGGPHRRSARAPQTVWVGPTDGLGGPHRRSWWAPQKVWVGPTDGLGGPQRRSGRFRGGSNFVKLLRSIFL